MVLLTSNLSNCTRLVRLKRRILSRAVGRVTEIFYRVETRSPQAAYWAVAVPCLIRVRACP